MAGKAGAGNGAESEDLHLRTYLHRSYATTLRKTSPPSKPLLLRRCSPHRTLCVRRPGFMKFNCWNFQPINKNFMKLKHLLTLALTVLTATVVRADVTVTVTAPSDAVCSVTQKPGNKHYAPFIVYSEVSQETADGMTKHTFTVPSTAKELAYRVSRPGSMTITDWFKPAKTPDITVDEATLSANTEHYCSRDSKEQYYADIYLNINQRGQLNLKSEGGYHDIVNLRTWQLTASTTGNNFLEPDFYYTVLNTDFQPDNSVVEVDADGHLTPKAPGTAIVQVRYNALGFHGKNWSEIWAENTGTFVVTVDADTDAMPADNIHLAYKPTNPMDAEHDILYYLSDQPGYSLTFTPQAGCTVTVANPVVDTAGNTVSYPDAFSAKNVTANADGSVTVLLTFGRNIIRTADNAGNASYQVLSAKPMTSEICYPRDDKFILPGDHVKLQFSGYYIVSLNGQSRRLIVR